MFNAVLRYFCWLILYARLVMSAEKKQMLQFLFVNARALNTALIFNIEILSSSISTVMICLLAVLHKMS